jgi:hypothetical protein
MSPLACLPKVAALSAVLLCGPPSSLTERPAGAMVTVPRPTGLQCRRYLGCWPARQVAATATPTSLDTE